MHVLCCAYLFSSPSRSLAPAAGSGGSVNDDPITPGSPGQGASGEGPFVSEENEHTPLLKSRSGGKRLSFKTFLFCFSLLETFPALMSVSRRRTTIHCFDGMRTLSMMWVVLGHCWLRIALQGPDNPQLFIQSTDTLWFQAVANTQYAVDTFFFLSGFLVAYTVLGMLARKRPRGWGQYYLHRYVRLTPAYAFVMLVFIFVRQPRRELKKRKDDEEEKKRKEKRMGGGGRKRRRKKKKKK